jgi:hypothetical protein
MLLLFRTEKKDRPVGLEKKELLSLACLLQVNLL